MIENHLIKKVLKEYKYLVIIMVLLATSFSVTMFADRDDNRKRIENQIKIYDNERIQSEKKRIIGKKLKLETLFSKNLTEKFTHNHSVLLYFTSSDCQSCFEKAMSFILSSCDTLFNKYNFFFIGGANVNSVHFKEHLINEMGIQSVNIIIDKKNILNLELNNFFTPVFILVDKNFRVLDLYYPSRGLEENLQQYFLQNLKKYS